MKNKISLDTPVAPYYMAMQVNSKLGVPMNHMTGKMPKRKPRPGVDEYGRIPLHYACADANESQVLLFISSGANVNAQDDNGYTPLHFAAQAGSDLITESLLSNGADPNFTDSHGNSPLWTAVMNSKGRTQIISKLLSKGANPDLINKHGRSPRMVALLVKGGIENLFLGDPDGNA